MGAQSCLCLHIKFLSLHCALHVFLLWCESHERLSVCTFEQEFHRLNVGDVIKFGESTRLYIVEGPQELLPVEYESDNLVSAVPLVQSTLKTRFMWYMLRHPLLHERQSALCHREASWVIRDLRSSPVE